MKKTIKKTVMTKPQARQMAKTLIAEGKTYEQAAKALAAKGYVGPKSGKPVSVSEIARLVVRKPRMGDGRSKAKTSSKAPSLTLKQARARLDAVSRILAVDVLPAEERVAMAQLVLGGSHA